MDLPISYQHLVDTAINPPSAYELKKSEITPSCMQSVSEKFQIPEVILEAYLRTEGAKSGQIVKNKNNSYDIGPMQINSVNWKLFYEKFNIKPIDLRFNGCLNLAAGAYLIRERLDRYGKDNITSWDEFFFAIASYHSFTPTKNDKYQKIWINNLNNLLGVK